MGAGGGSLTGKNKELGFQTKRCNPVLDFLEVEIPGFELPNRFSGLNGNFSPEMEFIELLSTNFKEKINYRKAVLLRIKLDLASQHATRLSIEHTVCTDFS